MKKLNIIISAYLIITGLVGIINLLDILTKTDHYNLLVLLSIVFLCLSISITILNNFFILKRLNNIPKKSFLTNFIICSLQVFSLSLNGFQFKFNQGIEATIYTNIGSIGNFNIGAYFNNFNLALKIEFLNVDSTSIEVNILALLLTVFYYIQIHNSNRRIS
ncbi:hypothetical protein FA048_18650 [Pedobacter polaris]|uniref:Uncharacterized protein n=1 Tax=Pedobacter polaris TaxID=2571273 RepID=A0A4U1CEM5_9SPHI|nr:hypothetical protein [Pedobacter polaris]TKC04709.1 hypothetical protein FA048_18650 [Pedobacter polaris]